MPNQKHNHIIDENTYKRLLDNLNTAIVWLDTDLNIIYINHASEALFEVSGKLVEGEPLVTLLHDNNSTIEALARAGLSGAVFTEREAMLSLHRPLPVGLLPATCHPASLLADSVRRIQPVRMA